MLPCPQFSIMIMMHASSGLIVWPPRQLAISSYAKTWFGSGFKISWSRLLMLLARQILLISSPKRCVMVRISAGCATHSWVLSLIFSLVLFWQFITLGNNLLLRGFLPQLKYLSLLATLPICGFLLLPPSFELSPTFHICRVLVGSSFGKLMASSLHLFCEILPSIYPWEILSHFSFCCDARMGVLVCPWSLLVER